MTKVFVIGGIAAILTALGIYFAAYLLKPPPLEPTQNTSIYSVAGNVVGEENGMGNRYWVELEEMSPHIIDASLMIEDQDFFQHHGLHFKRIAGAALENIQSMSLSEGASTITQQLARNLYLTHEKSWVRKIKEAFYALRLEAHYSKEEILEAYLNTAYYGHGNYGVEAASRYFFDKSAADLTLADSALLAGVPKGATYYSPFNNMKNASDRQELILNVMQQEGVISSKEEKQANTEEIDFQNPENIEKETVGPYFQDAVIKEASQLLDINEADVRSGGFNIHTTLNADLQKLLEAQVNTTFDDNSKMQIGAMAMNPHNGAILALIGGRDYDKSQFNRAINANRNAGSTFKPFLYYAALENGFTANTMLMSEPTEFTLSNGEVYQPSNYNGYYAHRPITLAQALALSDNIYAMKTNMHLGPGELVSTAEDFGLTSELQDVPSLALGSGSVTVYEMVQGYSMIANGGKDVTGHTIEYITNAEGNLIYTREEAPEDNVLDPQSTFILSHLMTGMFDRELDGYMSVTGSGIADDLTRLYGGKSGSTSADSWMIGFSPSLVTGIWTGYDDNRTLEIVDEFSYAKEVWAGFMEKAHEGRPNEHFPAPEGVVGVPIDPVTGKRATPACETSRMMYFASGTEPTDYCNSHEQPNEGETEEGKGLIQEWFEFLF